MSALNEPGPDDLCYHDLMHGAERTRRPQVEECTMPQCPRGASRVDSDSP